MFEDKQMGKLKEKSYGIFEGEKKSLMLIWRLFV